MRIALFPLEVVLFPGMALPLHIFEPRYKLMIRRGLEKKLTFGVVLAGEEGITTVGCMAEIVKLVREYPDGRMDILTAGQRRFTVSALFQEQPYLEAEVEYLEEAAEPAPPRIAAKLLELYGSCSALLQGRRAPAPQPAGDASLSFHVAASLPLELSVKQQALEMPGEARRQEYLCGVLERWLPTLERLARSRSKAAGNGRGVN